MACKVLSWMAEQGNLKNAVRAPILHLNVYFFFSPFSRRFVHSPRLAPRPDYGISEDFPSEKCNKKAIIKYLFLHNETVYSDESSYAKFLLSDPRWFYIDPSIPVVQHYTRIWNGSRKKSHPNEIFRMLNLCSLRCIFIFFVVLVRFWPLVAMFHLCQGSSISLNLWRKAIWSTDMKKKIVAKIALPCLPWPPDAAHRKPKSSHLWPRPRSITSRANGRERAGGGGCKQGK